MLQFIKDRAAELLWQLDSCPSGLLRPSNELLPCLEFSNGMYHPAAASYPPFAVYFDYQGVRWRLDRKHNKWQRS